MTFARQEMHYTQHRKFMEDKTIRIGGGVGGAYQIFILRLIHDEYELNTN